jgi:hypothetical protein
MTNIFRPVFVQEGLTAYFCSDAPESGKRRVVLDDGVGAVEPAKVFVVVVAPESDGHLRQLILFNNH